MNKRAQKNQKVNPKTLKGSEKKERVMDLMEQIDPHKDNTLKTSKVELIKKGPDGKIYGIVRENKKYFVKRGITQIEDEEGKPVIGESDLKYIGNLSNKTKYAFPSYSEALKQMNMMFTNIFESQGQKNNITNPSVSDSVILKEGSVAEKEHKNEEGNSDEENTDGTILYDDEEKEVDENEKLIDDLINNKGEKKETKEIKKESKKDDKFSLKKAILEGKDVIEEKEADSYKDFFEKIKEKHGIKNLEDADEEQLQNFFAELDKWTSDEEESYMKEEDEGENNAWAICNAQANKDGGWSDEKIERCVKDVKKKNESHEPGKKKVAEEDEELEDKRYVLRAPDDEGGGEDSEDPLAGLDDEDIEGSLEGGEETDGEEESTPFDDGGFDAGVEADEEEEPKRYIQQLTGKLSQSLRGYLKDEKDPDLEQYVINMLLDAANLDELSDEEQEEMINKIKGGGEQENNGEEEPLPKDYEEDVEGEEEVEPGKSGGSTGEEDEDEESIEDELGDEIKK